MNLTESQQAAILHRGGSALVAASAGSGKTEVLARRCVELIADADNPCSVERLAVVTFTRAAASELRARIARMLRLRAAGEADAALRRRLFMQEMLVATAEIGTIDGWCGRIVRENFAAAEVDARFAILGEQDAALLHAETLDDLFTWVYRDEHPVAQRAREWLSALPAPSDEPLRGLVTALNRYREHLANPDAWLAQARAAATQSDDAAKRDAEALIHAALQREVDFQQVELAAALSAGQLRTRKLAQYAEKLDEWSTRLRRPGALSTTLADIAAFKPPRLDKKIDGPEPAFTTDVMKRWRERRLTGAFDADEVARIIEFAPQAARRVATLIDLEALYEARLQSAKRQRAVCEFGDVLRLALNLLGDPTPDGVTRTPSDIARRLRDRYDHILVDEFQDTSPVQVEIVRLLAREARGAANRFLVGDVKQSIYGFREAEPRLFAALADALSGGDAEGRLLFLSDNFRSHRGVLEPLNTLFSALFHRELGGAAYDQRERLVARRAEIDNESLDGRPRVQVVMIEREQAGEDDARETDDTSDQSGGASVDELEKIEVEALHAARVIREHLDAGALVPERDGAGLRLRPARLGDFVILLRSAAKNAAHVARRLREAGVPALTGGRESVLDTMEGLDLRTLLALLANRRQDLALAAYLRGPSVRLREPDLLAIRGAADGPFHAAVDAYRATGADAALRARLEEAFRRLDKWTLAAREMDLPALLRKIIRESGYELFVRALGGGEHRAATLDALLALAEQFSAGGNQGAAEFAQYLDSLAEVGVEPAAPVAAAQDAIRIMTIHASKGLEFPFVLLLNAGARFNNRVRSEPFQADDAVGLGIRTADYASRATITSAAHFVLSRRAYEEGLSEELRLLYVAATRARERLWIIGHGKVGGFPGICERVARGPLPLIARLGAGSMLDWVLMALAAQAPAESEIAAAGFALTALRANEVRSAFAEIAATPRPATVTHNEISASVADDEMWIRRAYEAMTWTSTDRAASTPAVLSVSAMKEEARRARESDRPAYAEPLSFVLNRPQFLHESDDDDGRILGTATHRFLELADLTRIATAADITAQRDALVAGARLSAAEAALTPVDDLEWLGRSEIGRFLAENAANCHRETPFVRASPVADSPEFQIVRGVMDCIVRTPDGLTIVDYKTDRIRDEQALGTRFETYAVQIKLYAAAAAAIFGVPVRRATLVFLCARRVMDVPLE